MTKSEILKAFERAVKKYGHLCKKNCASEKLNEAWDLVSQLKHHSEKAGASAAEIANILNRTMVTV